jgi:hypothetical protein
MRKLTLWLLLAAPVLANAGPITFDFETLPDSSGCKVPVTSHGAPRPIPSSCDLYWVVANSSSGIGQTMVDTEHGLTMEVTDNELTNAIWWNGTFMCGNTFECQPYIFSFSRPLSEIRVDFSGYGGDATYVDGTFSYTISAFSGEGGSGDLLATVAVNDIPTVPASPWYHYFPLSLSLFDIGKFQSVSVAAVGFNGEAFTNLARVEAIHAVPEPGALLILAAALSGFLWLRSSLHQGNSIAHCCPRRRIVEDAPGGYSAAPQST